MTNTTATNTSARLIRRIAIGFALTLSLGGLAGLGAAPAKAGVLPDIPCPPVPKPLLPGGGIGIVGQVNPTIKGALNTANQLINGAPSVLCGPLHGITGTVNKTWDTTIAPLLPPCGDCPIIGKDIILPGGGSKINEVVSLP